MFVDEIWDFKSLNMGRELEIAGEFIYDSAKKIMSISGLNNTYEINIILYTGAVGIERLQKIYLCLVAQDPTDISSMPKCLKQHNHIELQREVNKFSERNVSKKCNEAYLVYLRIIIIISDMQIIIQGNMEMIYESCSLVF